MWTHVLYVLESQGWKALTAHLWLGATLQRLDVAYLHRLDDSLFQFLERLIHAQLLWNLQEIS